MAHPEGREARVVAHGMGDPVGDAARGRHRGGEVAGCRAEEPDDARTTAQREGEGERAGFHRYLTRRVRIHASAPRKRGCQVSWRPRSPKRVLAPTSKPALCSCR